MPQTRIIAQNLSDKLSALKVKIQDALVNQVSRQSTGKSEVCVLIGGADADRWYSCCVVVYWLGGYLPVGLLGSMLDDL